MTVTYERHGRVAVITIDRPEVRNAVDRATAESLGEAWRRFDLDPEADVGILFGAGGSFSSGADLKAFDLEDGPDGFLGFTRMQVAKPTVAAVEGFCVAGGLEMALWCDLRVAGASAVFGCFERRFGVPLIDGGTQRLPRVVGQGLALEMILTGRRVEAEEAHAVGLVNTVVGDGDALAYATMLAERISASPQETVRSDRLAVLEGLGRPLAAGLEIERQHGLRVLDVAAHGAQRFAAGAGRSGTPVAREDPVPIVVESTDGAVAAAPGEPPEPKIRIPAGGFGNGALVIEGPGSHEMVERLVALGLAVETVHLGSGSIMPDPSLEAVQAGIDTLLHSGVVKGEQVALVASGEAASFALWASTLDTRIGAVVVFGLSPWNVDIQPRYRMSTAAYMGHQGGVDPALDEVKPASLEMTMRDVDLDATFHVYRKASSRFFDPESDDHEPNLADLAWKRTRLFLQRVL